ncbi:EcsC family protein [Robertkochia marina]|uniref:EcsC family protein n=1 Tax=Robertkochia marina TaxID=1227945 RepID=A0A4S3LXY8_9FLAO|nr:EcsC family protein [Robertkochia marina]THD66440.1 EcsC family protein [Robertkochia marina]TRZ44117.1 EcsC family protein [Robertkochia marina]
MERSGPEISKSDLQRIADARSSLENPGWMIKAVNSIGIPIESLGKRVPTFMQTKIQVAIEKTLQGIIKANLLTIQKGKVFSKPKNSFYKGVVGVSGAASGFLGSTTGIGTAAFITELGLSTQLMMRSIMDIARSHGEDLYDHKTQLACMEVFALGGTSKDDDGAETSYYATRYALTAALGQINKTTLNKTLGLAMGYANTIGIEALSRFVAMIAGRFSTVASEKFIAQSIPILGAAGGSGLNVLFIHHFQKMGDAHFTLRNMERKYGEEAVKAAYYKS